MMGALPSNSDRLNTCPWPEEHLPHDHAKHRTRSILARLMGQEVALAGVAAVLNTLSPKSGVELSVQIQN